MKVIKNTYLRRCCQAGIEGLDDTFVGPTAIYTDNADDITEPARIVSDEDDFDVIEIKVCLKVS